MADKTTEPLIGAISKSLDDPLESHFDVSLAFAKQVQSVCVATDGITSNAISFGNQGGIPPINPFLLNLLAIGGQADCALALMPPQVDAASLRFPRLLLVCFHGTPPNVGAESAGINKSLPDISNP